MPIAKVGKLFRPLKVCDEQLLVTGGYNRQPEPCPYKSSIHEHEKLLFLRVEAREPWLVKGACGYRQISKGLSGRTTLLDELRDKLERACDGEPTVPQDLRCHGEAPEASSSTDDPMAQVAEDEVVVLQNVKKQALSRNRYYRSNCKDKVILVSMPERARETGIDEGDRMVRLYCEDRRKIWLCTKDADWALLYLHDQLAFQGVPRVAPGDRGPGARPEAPVPAGPPVVAGPLHLTDGVHEMENVGPVDEWHSSSTDLPASSIGVIMRCRRCRGVITVVAVCIAE